MTIGDNPKDDPARLQVPHHAKAATAIDKKLAASETTGVAMLTIVVVGVMALGKLATGLLINSVALLSEGLHTFVDLFAAIISYYTVRAASVPADLDHRYGHGKIDNIAGIAQSAFIFVPTIIIIYRAIEGIIHLDTVLTGGGVGIGTIVMLVTIFVNIFLAMRLLAVAKKHKSEAIRAAAFHQLNDLWTSVGVFVALGLIWLIPGWKILDPVVALLVTAISIYMASDLLIVSAASLIDKAAGKDVDRTIIDVIESKKPLVRGYHNLRTRMAGSTIYVDMHLEICGELSFKDAHSLTEEIEEEIVKKLGSPDVITHIDPCMEDCAVCEIKEDVVEDD
ncbi:MAG: cation diffusion facilitator family transporter [bacterium]|nr:cation diffusion facilitator family transporter [bacterium]